MLSTLSKQQCFFPLCKQFLETETNHYKRLHFQKSELIFCVPLKGKIRISK